MASDQLHDTELAVPLPEGLLLMVGAAGAEVTEAILLTGLAVPCVLPASQRVYAL